MEKYNEVIQENSKVEMVHVSLDRAEDAAEAWAVSEAFPWYTILPKDVERSGFYQFKSTRAVPEYVLISADGEIVEPGSSNPSRVFGKIQEVAR